MLYEVTVKVCVEAENIIGPLVEQQRIIDKLYPMNIKEISTREIATTTVTDLGKEEARKQ